MLEILTFPPSSSSSPLSAPPLPSLQLILNDAEELDAAALAANGWSEVLPGARIAVTLRSDTGGAPSRLVVKGYVAGGVCDAPSGQSICGTTDDRVNSTDPRQGRIGGCTGWLISEDVFIQVRVVTPRLPWPRLPWPR